MILARPIILIMILPLLFTVHAPLTVRAVTPVPVALGVLGEGYSAPDIIDPSLAVGTELNMTVEADDIPPIIDASQGGLQGFDISLSYNSTMLRVVDSGLHSPYCISSEGCLYSNANENQILILNNSIGTANRVERFAMIATNPGLRATGPGVLFKISFKVLALGLTTISILQNVSQLYGFSNHCAQFLSYTTTNATLDNRRPFRLLANPLSFSMLPGQSKSTNVTVYRVNSAGDGDVTLLLSGIETNQITYSFSPRTSTLDGLRGIFSFNSNLAITTSPSAPIATYHLEIVAQLASTLNQFDQARLNFTLYLGSQYGPALSVPTLVPLRPPLPTYSNAVTAGAPSDLPLPLLGRFNVTSPVIAGVPVTFTPTVCGGTIPYHASWKFGDGNATIASQTEPGVGSSTSHRYASPGSYQVSMTVADASGRTFTTSQTITVSGISQASPLVGMVETGIILIAFVLIIAVAYLRRHRKTRS